MDYWPDIDLLNLPPGEVYLQEPRRFRGHEQQLELAIRHI
jgi:hypothetical protein